MTERLLAERLRASDFDDLYRMNQTAEVMKTIGGIRSAEVTREYVASNLDHWDRHGFGLWILRGKGSDAFVGSSALRCAKIDGRDEVELGYALMPDCWGDGLATEIARALLEIAFSRLSLADVVAFMLPTNVASRRVVEKVGGVYEREIVHADIPHVLYRVVRG